MILPSKHISEKDALIGVGAVLLNEIDRPRTVTQLWESARRTRAVGTFERFVLVLNMLYIVGAVHLEDGLIARTR